jgi:general secretion pathway protein C
LRGAGHRAATLRAQRWSLPKAERVFEMSANPRLTRALAAALLAALGALALVAAARLAWTLVDFTRDPLPSVAPRSVDSLLADQATQPVSIAQWRLFGALTSAPDGRDPMGAPDTTLKLTVLGVIAAEDPKSGIAILRSDEAGERRYGVGDEVAPGVLLDSVLPDRILLSRGGVLETLRLPRELLPGAAGPASPLPTVAAPNPALPPSAAGIAAANPAGQPFVTPNIAPAGIDWNQAMANLKVDPAQLAREVSLLPVLEGGKMVGVRVNAGPNQALVNAMGLRADDVVTAINGIPLDSPGRAAEVAQALSNARSATIEVRRDGRTETLSVNAPN